MPIEKTYPSYTISFDELGTLTLEGVVNVRKNGDGKILVRLVMEGFKDAN